VGANFFDIALIRLTGRRNGLARWLATHLLDGYGSFRSESGCDQLVRRITESDCKHEERSE
jgi:hypothetical protein